MRIRDFTCLVAVAGAAAGCAYHHYTYATPEPVETTVTVRPAQPPAPPPAPAVESQTQSFSDQDLVTSVQHQFTRYGALSGDLPNITVIAQNGTVTLTGMAENERDKEMIDAMVRNTPGVVDVVDELTTSGHATTIAPTSRPGEKRWIYSRAFNLHVQGLSPADRALGEQILEGLRTDSALGGPIPKVDIYVSRGRVALVGTVNGEAQRENIVAAVQRAAGTQNVEDELDMR